MEQDNEIGMMDPLKSHKNNPPRSLESAGLISVYQEEGDPMSPFAMYGNG